VSLLRPDSSLSLASLLQINRTTLHLMPALMLWLFTPRDHAPRHAAGGQVAEQDRISPADPEAARVGG
jgi:hypothetical protein